MPDESNQKQPGGIVRLNMLDQLLLDGALSPPAHEAAVRFVSEQNPWRLWADRLSLLLGATLLLSGIIFFFAFNWARISGLGKLGLVEALLLGTLFAAFKTGQDKLVGRVLLLAASVLVGVFLAVFGQVYQTGADAWTLFALWSLLIIPWVVLARFPGLCVLWIVLQNTALILYWDQVGWENPALLFLLLGLLNTAYTAGREWLDRRGLSWAAPLWPRRLLVNAALTWPVMTTLSLIMGEQRFNVPALLGVLLLLAQIVSGLTYFRRGNHDLAALALIVLASDLVVLFLIARILFEIGHGSLTFLVLTLAIMAVFTLSGSWLLRQRTRAGEVKHV